MMKPCPFCGTSIDENDRDVVYPSGIGWIEIVEEGVSIRTYHNFKDVPMENRCFQVVCSGCEVTMCGDSKEEAISNWNKRVIGD